MDKKNKKSVIQMTATKDEIDVVKIVSVIGNFSTVSDYIRSLVTADVVARKKAHKHPEIFGISTYDWDELSEPEREEYLNKIGTVKPGSMDYFLRVKKGETMPPNELGL